MRADTQYLILGGGAVVTEFHLPALAMLGWLDRVRVADPSARAIEAISHAFPGVAATRCDFREALRAARGDGVRAAIVALPNALHEEAVDLGLDTGLDLLCEKPLALTEAVCARLASKADVTDRLLAVGMVRRLVPAVQAVRSALAAGWIGDVLEVEVSWGAPFAWPTESGEYFKAENAGVLANLGVHTLDLLEYLFGRLEPVSYVDDWGGGAEANATYTLRTSSGARVKASFSYTTELANQIRMGGTKGEIRLGHDSPEAVFRDTQHSVEARISMPKPFAHGNWQPTLHACFAEQIVIFDEAVKRRVAAHASGWDATRTAALIDWAYEHHRRPRPRAGRTSAALPEGRIVVTGGTGFVGSHLLEHLVVQGCDDIRVPVRSYRSGAAAGRFPVQMTHASLLDRAAVRAVVDGARFVFHLAYGSDGDDAAQVTVDGTRHVVDAAIDAGAEAVVVMSTTAILGRSNAPVDESSPNAPTNDYERLKAKAEQWSLQRAASSPQTRIVVLNSSCVYGPRGNAFTELPARLVADQSFYWVDNGSGIVNYVYVDNLVDAMLLAARCEAAHGERFIVCDGATTWRHFFTQLLPETALARSYDAQQLRDLAKSAAPKARDLVGAILRNPEVWRIVRENPGLSTIKSVMRAVPGVPAWVSTRRANPPEPYEALPPAPPPWLADLYGPDRTTVSSAKARRVLGWVPRVDLTAGMVRSRSWLSEVGLVRDATR